MELPAYFEALMHRAPIPASDIFTYLREMRRTPSGPLVTSKLLAGKIQSKSEAQAIHAFEFLEAALEAETEGSIEFRTEIGRYRFLNEIIRILSPKYLGEVTPQNVKERAIRFLCDAAGPKKQRWFPSEHSKIKMVYQSLVDTGIIMKTAEDESAAADAAEAELQKSIFDRAENAAILKKLLSSTDPADLNAANRLIKSLADEESKRNERRAELHSLIDRIETSTSLLTEMLDQPTLDRELTDDLVVTCNSLRQKLGAIATETNGETTAVLQASENIEKALKFYEERKDLKSPTKQPSTTTTETDLLSQPSVPFPDADQQLHSSFSLADELLMGISDEFSLKNSKAMATRKTDNENLLLNFDLEIGGGDGTKVVESTGSVDIDKPDKTPDTLNEIERLSRELMQQGLKNSTGKSPVFVVKKTEKAATLSQLQKSSNTSSQEASLNLTTSVSLENDLKSSSNHSNLAFLDLDFLENPKKTEGAGKIGLNLSLPINDSAPNKSPRGSTSNEDDSLLNLSENRKNESQEILPSKAEERHPGKIQPSFCLNSVKGVDLDDVELIEKVDPIELRLVTENNDGTHVCKDVSVTLTLGRVPRFPQSVQVAVITLSNRNSSSELFNYVFQLLPPKGMQVKLLAPSNMELAPWKKSFLPPPMLTQVALLMSPVTPQSEKARIKYILSYCLGEDTALHNGHFDFPTISSDSF